MRVLALLLLLSTTAALPPELELYIENYLKDVDFGLRQCACPKEAPCQHLVSTLKNDYFGSEIVCMEKSRCEEEAFFYCCKDCKENTPGITTQMTQTTTQGITTQIPEENTPGITTQSPQATTPGTTTQNPEENTQGITTQSPQTTQDTTIQMTRLPTATRSTQSTSVETDSFYDPTDFAPTSTVKTTTTTTPMQITARRVTAPALETLPQKPEESQKMILTTTSTEPARPNESTNEDKSGQYNLLILVGAFSCCAVLLMCSAVLYKCKGKKENPTTYSFPTTKYENALAYPIPLTGYERPCPLYEQIDHYDAADKHTTHIYDVAEPMDTYANPKSPHPVYEIPSQQTKPLPLYDVATEFPQIPSQPNYDAATQEPQVKTQPIYEAASQEPQVKTQPIYEAAAPEPEVKTQPIYDAAAQEEITQPIYDAAAQEEITQPIYNVSDV